MPLIKPARDPRSGSTHEAVMTSATPASPNQHEHETAAFAEALKPEPKFTGLARFGDLASRLSTSLPFGLIVGVGAQIAISHAVGHPVLSSMAGCWIGWKAVKFQQNFAGPLASWAGERTAAQEARGPRASYWAVRKEHSKTVGFAFAIVGDVVKSIASVAALWVLHSALQKVAPKLERKWKLKSLAGDEKRENAFESMRDSAVRRTQQSMESLFKIGLMGSAVMAWKSANALLLLGHPQAAADLWDATRFDPSWPCSIEQDKRNQPKAPRMSFPQALAASFAKREAEIQKDPTSMESAVAEHSTDAARVAQVADMARRLQAEREAQILTAELALAVPGGDGLASAIASAPPRAKKSARRV